MKKPKKKAKKAKTKKKRNPQDSTLRNVRAANKRIITTMAQVEILKVRLDSLENRISHLEHLQEEQVESFQ